MCRRQTLRATRSLVIFDVWKKENVMIKRHIANMNWEREVLKATSSVWLVKLKNQSIRSLIAQSQLRYYK